MKCNAILHVNLQSNDCQSEELQNSYSPNIIIWLRPPLPFGFEFTCVIPFSFLSKDTS